MRESTDQGLRRDAIGDHVADSADHRPVWTNLAGQAGTGLEPSAEVFEVHRLDHPLGVVLTLSGELDLATVPLLQAQLDRAMREQGAVVLDLSGLRFIDSSGLHTLLRAERQLRASGGRLVLVHAPRPVRRVFELASVDRYFAWSDSPSEAIRTAGES